MSLVGLGLFIIMEFFNQLLTSYNLLKKRKLQVTLDEESPGAKLTKFSEVEKISRGNSEHAEAARQATEKAQSETEQMFASPPDTEYRRQATPGNPIPIARRDDTGKLIPYGKPAQLKVKSDLAVKYYLELVNQGVAQDGEVLSVETQELLSRTGVQELVDKLNEEEDGAGSRLVGELGEVYRLSNELGLDSLFLNRSTSIPNKVVESLTGKKYQFSTEEDALAGRLIGDKYTRPTSDQVIGSLQNLKQVLSLYKKSETTEGLSQNEYEYLKNTIKRVSYRAGGRESFRVFVRSSEIDKESLGLSFDWRSDTAPTDLQNVIRKLEENLDRLATDEKIDDYDGLPFVEVTPPEGRVDSHVIGDVAEDCGPIVSLLQMGETKKAAKLFEELFKKHGKKISDTFKLNDAATDGDLIGTQITEETRQFVNELKENFQSDDARTVFSKLLPTLISSVANDIMRMKPDFVMRVGGGRAGIGGDKTDQVLFYDTAESAAEASKEAGTEAKVGKLKDILSDKELERAKELYGNRIDENKDYHYIDDSLKCTNDPGRTNLGTGAGPLVMAQDFRNEDDTWSQGLIKTLGLKGATKQATMANFEQVEADSRLLNSIFDAGGTSVSPEESANTFIAALDGGALASLGIEESERKSIKKLIKDELGRKGGGDIAGLKRKLEHGILTKRIENGSAVGDESWRAVGALMMMRGCYDTSKGSKLVVDYLTGNNYRYNGNKPMMKKFKNYMKTGEGWTSSKGDFGTGSSFGIGGYTCKFTHSAATGTVGTKFDGPVERGSVRKLEAGPENSSTEYSTTELMNMLLEVQQLIFSNLVKE